ncbi:hypothetical protein [Streptomyces sp. AMCC400023]|uniref:hypothetical protein n=1 Tax=Streptomyces sp. AMCC400023 TaxID=2056258 RepID=UPI001F2BF98D|nr:hypothetical protein [Streptomyces sp. AMCC400023]UJV41616.1 hypothetical protein CVT30_18705 [Streptomyces sp. AMCC400023]
MPKLTTEQVTTHTIVLTDTELAEWREAARCALDLGGDKDEHTDTWRTISRLGLSALRGDRVDSVVIHACPPDGTGLTPCCGRTPLELPRTHRMTNDPAMVTCGQTRRSRG